MTIKPNLLLYFLLFPTINLPSFQFSLKHHPHPHFLRGKWRASFTISIQLKKSGFSFFFPHEQMCQSVISQVSRHQTVSRGTILHRAQKIHLYCNLLPMPAGTANLISIDGQRKERLIPSSYNVNRTPLSTETGV